MSDTDVIKVVVNNEPTDANYRGWDILISVPFGDGSPGWACVAETRDDRIRDAIVTTLHTVHDMLADSAAQQRKFESPGIEGILERKRAGIDCTEDESVEVLNYFTDNAEYLSDSDNADLDQVVQFFSLEWNQWWQDKEFS
jgi:hypothetical protein